MTKNTLLDSNAKDDTGAESLFKEAIIRIEGGHPLHGSVRIQGSKNATLPILAACLLIPGKCVIHNCPMITDVTYMLKLLEYAGCIVERKGSDVIIDACHISEFRLPGSYVRKMRSSVILMGALLGRIHEVGIDYPGGCVIGERPIDLHLRGLEALGANISIEGNYIYASAKKLQGTTISFPFSSVGATQNVLLAAVLAEGETCIQNAAKEPEIEALCHFLKLAGADIEGAGTGQIVVRGVEELHPVEYEMIPDRIVAGTYLFAAMAAGGEIDLKSVPIAHLESVLHVIRDMGGELLVRHADLEVRLQVGMNTKNLPFIETDVYPGFPTDLQSPLLSTAVVTKGSLLLKEKIFPGRFKIVEELCRMGANIREEQDCVLIGGSSALEGRNVIARELRGGAALVIAGLAARGITTIMDTSYIYRGYEDIVRDLRALDACITIDKADLSY